MTDIRIQRTHGLAIFYPETEEGEAWLEKELGQCMDLDGGWPVEDEYVADQVRCAEGDGLTVFYE
jgi:hypothetical protein